jgi:hypothetical protein
MVVLVQVGLDEGEECRSVVLVEVKTGKSALTSASVRSGTPWKRAGSPTASSAWTGVYALAEREQLDQPETR